ncbi:GIY-YIG nuclease family protein, partial [Paraclostridium benzoelyticum]|nr:GIY-YIG nuclease family protein [Paraclostridium benzoelyticum]
MKNCVYRFKDKDDNVIYVGKANDLLDRLYSHEKLELYQDEVESIDYISFPSRFDMLLAEQHYISTLKPKLNSFYIDNKYKSDDLDFEYIKNNEFKTLDHKGLIQRKNLLKEYGDGRYLNFNVNLSIDDLLKLIGALELYKNTDLDDALIEDKLLKEVNKI